MLFIVIHTRALVFERIIRANGNASVERKGNIILHSNCILMFCLPYYKTFKGKRKSFVKEQMGTSSTNTECITVWPLPEKGQVSPKCDLQRRESRCQTNTCIKGTRRSFLPLHLSCVREKAIWTFYRCTLKRDL